MISSKYPQANQPPHSGMLLLLWEHCASLIFLPLPYLDGLGGAGFYCLAWFRPKGKQAFSLAFIPATDTGFPVLTTSEASPHLSVSHTWFLKVLVWVNSLHQQCIFLQRRKVHGLCWSSNYPPLGQAQSLNFCCHCFLVYIFCELVLRLWNL